MIASCWLWWWFPYCGTYQQRRIDQEAAGALKNTVKRLYNKVIRTSKIVCFTGNFIVKTSHQITRSWAGQSCYKTEHLFSMNWKETWWKRSFFFICTLLTEGATAANNIAPRFAITPRWNAREVQGKAANHRIPPSPSLPSKSLVRLQTIPHCCHCWQWIELSLFCNNKKKLRGWPGKKLQVAAWGEPGRVKPG